CSTVMVPADSIQTTLAQQDTSKLLKQLQSSIYPDQRETAVNSLASVNWRANPHVPVVVLTCAQTHQSPGVRIPFTRCLVRMKVNAPTVITTLQRLRDDRDPNVQCEALDALVRLEKV